MDDLVPPTPPSAKQDKPMPVIKSSLVEPEVKEKKKGLLSKIFKKGKETPAASRDPIEKTITEGEQALETNATPAVTADPEFEIPEIPKEEGVSDDDLDEIRRALGLGSKPQPKQETKFSILKKPQKVVEQKIEKPAPVEVPEVVEQEEKDVSKDYDWTNHKELEQSVTASDKTGFTEEPAIEEPEAEEALPEEDKEEINDAIKSIVDDTEVTKEEPEEYFSSMEKDLKQTKIDAVEQAKAIANKQLADSTKLAKIRKILNDYEKKIDSKIKSASAKTASERRDIEKQRSAMEDKMAKFSAKEKEMKEKEQRLIALRQETATLREESQSIKRQINSDREEAESAEGALLTIRQQLKQNKKSFEEKDAMYKERLSELDKLAKKTEKDYKTVQQRTAGLLIRLKSREDAIAAKEKEVRALVEEERRIFDYIQKGNPESEGFIKQVLKAEPVRQTSAPQQAQMGVSNNDDSEDKTIEEKIDDCKQILTEDNIEDAKLLYNEIRQEFASGTLTEMQKARVRQEIKELYEEISAKMMQKI